jgi:hypothetical protein
MGVHYANFTEMFGYMLQDVPTGADWLRSAFPDPTYRKAVVSDWKLSLEAVKLGEIINRTFLILTDSVANVTA